MGEAVYQRQGLYYRAGKGRARLHLDGFRENIVELAAGLALHHEVDGPLGVIKILVVGIEEDKLGDALVLEADPGMKAVLRGSY